MAFNSDNRNNADGNSYERYYLPRLDIKDYNAIIDGRNFYDNNINSDVEKYTELKSNDWKKRRLYYRIFARL